MRITENTLYNTDCLALLERMDSDQIALAYIDAPWGTNIAGDKMALGEYVTFLSKVLQQTHRILSDSGTLFFHDSALSRVYARLILDQIFGEENFLTEIVWLAGIRGVLTNTPRLDHDTILVFSKSDTFTYNPQYRPLSSDMRKAYRLKDQKGLFKVDALTILAGRSSFQFEWKSYKLPTNRQWRYPLQVLDQLEDQGRIYHPAKPGALPGLKIYLSDSPGILVGSIWDDIARNPSVDRLVSEQDYYLTGKPLALLDRIVKMASNPGDLVFDPFCGSGTALVAAHVNRRRWIGCDVLGDAYSLTMQRLESQLSIQAGQDFKLGDQEYIENTFPTVCNSYRDLVTGIMDDDVVVAAASRFILSQPVQMEETRGCEFKEVKGRRAVDAIRNTADEYAVAFLNDREGGRIYWGITNSDRLVKGVKLDHGQRDMLRRLVDEQLFKIQPAIEPGAYELEFHSVYDDGVPVSDLVVVELVVPAPLAPGPYYTGSSEAFVKTDAGKKKLSGPELTDWIIRYRLAEML